MSCNRRRVLYSAALLAFAVAAACGDLPDSPLAAAGGAYYLESPITASVGRSATINLPGDAWYDPVHSYVTIPNSETLSNIAEIEGDPHSQYVSVLCKEVGESWVKVYATHGEGWYWKIYPLTCTEPVLDDYLTGIIGREFYFDVREGLIVQYAYITIPYAETVSSIATARTQGEFIYVKCTKAGTAWVRVRTSNNYWKVYELVCKHDQGGGG